MTREQAEAWLKDMRLWCANNHPERSSAGYKQQKFGMTKHFLWVLGDSRGERKNYEVTDLLSRDRGPRMFTPDNHTVEKGDGWIKFTLKSQ